jgi:hypothetical protein
VISASIPGFDALAKRLENAARRMAEARLESSALARRGDPRRWRKAALLWPLITKG